MCSQYNLRCTHRHTVFLVDKHANDETQMPTRVESRRKQEDEAETKILCETGDEAPGKWRIRTWINLSILNLGGPGCETLLLYITCAIAWKVLWLRIFVRFLVLSLKRKKKKKQKTKERRNIDIYEKSVSAQSVELGHDCHTAQRRLQMCVWMRALIVYHSMFQFIIILLQKSKGEIRFVDRFVSIL